MTNRETLEALGKDKLIELIEIYSKDWLAADGLWFQSVEERWGMDSAMAADIAVWEQFTRVEARKIKAFLHLPERAGLDGLERALRLRLYANINRDEITRDGDTLTYRTLDCRVQTARARKGMPWHPCKQVGLVEYAGFAKAIDERIDCDCLSCFPEITDESCCCAWRFTLRDGI